MAVLPIRDRAYLVEHGVTFEEVDGNEKGVIFRDYILPAGRFDQTKADILVLLPPDIRTFGQTCSSRLPGSSSAGLRNIRAPLTRRTTSKQRWSRHNDQWRPGVDGIWTMLRRIDTALEAAA